MAQTRHLSRPSTPEEIAANPASYTGQYLKQALQRRGGAKAASGKRTPQAAE